MKTLVGFFFGALILFCGLWALGAFNYQPLEGETNTHYDLDPEYNIALPKSAENSSCITSIWRRGCI